MPLMLATLDGHGGSQLALRLLRQEDPKWHDVVVRSRRYLPCFN